MIKEKSRDLIKFCLIFLILIIIYFFPLLKGKILLPLDLLVNQKFPWNLSNSFAVKNPFLLDIIVKEYPWKSFVFDSLQKGILPLWNPYSLSGTPFLAAMQPAILYPLSLLFFLGNIAGWNLYLILQIFLSGVFCYLLARELKLNFWPSIFTAVSFAFHSYLVVFLLFATAGHVILWFPLFLLLALKLFKKIKILYAAAFCLSIAFSIFAGFFQIFLYGYLMLLSFIFYLYFFTKHKNIKKLFYLYLFSFLGVFLAAIQILPTYELLKQSPRLVFSVKELFSSGLLSVFHLIRFLAPDYFGSFVTRNVWNDVGFAEGTVFFGLVPLFFALFAVFAVKNNKIANFFKIVFVLSVLFALKGVGELIFFLRIPILSFNPGHRILSLTGFSGAVLAGFGLQSFLQARKKRQLKSFLIYGFLFFLLFSMTLLLKIFSAGQQQQNFSIGLRNLIFPLGILLLFGAVFFYTLVLKEKKKTFLILVIIITFLDLYRFGHKFLPFSETKYLYPETKATQFLKNKSKNLIRFYGPVEPDIHLPLRLYSIQGYSPLYILRYGKLINYLSKGVSEIAQRSWVIVDSKNKNSKRIFDLLGVKFLWHRKDYDYGGFVFPHWEFEGSFENIYDDGQTIIYKNLDSLPRYGLFYQYKTVSNEEEILKLLANKDFNIQNQLILEKDIKENIEPGIGKTKLVKNDLNSLSFEIETNKKALFFLSDTYFSGWQAWVNDKKVEIFRTNYAFRSVLVPAGKSKVDFIYRPESFFLGAKVSLISLLALTSILLVYKSMSSFFRKKN